MSKIEDSVNVGYYVAIRDTISKLEDISSRVTLQGMTFSGALLSLSALFYREGEFLAALAVSISSIVITLCFLVLTVFYTQLLGKAVETAKKVENKILKDWSNEEKLTHQMDSANLVGFKVAGTRTWLIVSLGFFALIVIEVILSTFYFGCFS